MGTPRRVFGGAGAGGMSENIRRTVRHRFYAINQSLRMWFIYRFFEGRTDVCWSEAVSWAYYPEFHPLSELRDLPGSAHARGCSSEACCYCGMWQDGEARR